MNVLEVCRNEVGAARELAWTAYQSYRQLVLARHSEMDLTASALYPLDWQDLTAADFGLHANFAVHRAGAADCLEICRAMLTVARAGTEDNGEIGLLIGDLDLTPRQKQELIDALSETLSVAELARGISSPGTATVAYAAALKVADLRKAAVRARLADLGEALELPLILIRRVDALVLSQGCDTGDSELIHWNAPAAA